MKKFLLVIFALTSACAWGQTSQALNQLVFEIRNPQTDAPHFRRALESIGEYLALNVLEELQTKDVTINTLTGMDATHALVDETPVLVTILRAGLPLNNGVQKVFPNSEVGFLAMSRNEETLKAKVDYIAIPNLKDRTVMITDTMLATGGSMVDAIQIIEKYEPKKIYVISAIASAPGIKRVLQYNPNVKIFAAVTDPTLNSKGYIMPGLGDAGDRAFGKKHKMD